MRPTSCPHIPAQLTIMSQVIVPDAPSSDCQSTAVTRRSCFCRPVTQVYSAMTAPRLRAPFASANAMLPGSPCPSLGRYTPPTTPSKFRWGYFSPTSAAEISVMSTPNARAIAAERFNSSIRSDVNAVVIDPTRRNPVARPVSASRLPYNSWEYFASLVMFAVARNWAIRPAACHVVPDVNCLRSNNTTSVHPNLVR